MSIEIPLKHKYRVRKPIGGYRTDYAGNSGAHRHKGSRGAVIGTGRTKVKLTVSRKRRLRSRQGAGSAAPGRRPAADLRRARGAGLRGGDQQALRLRSRRDVSRHQHERHEVVVLVHGQARAVPLRELPPYPVVEKLTWRERDVLGLAAELCSNAEIAERLLISLNTVKTHLRSAFRKLGAETRREAVARARQTGQLPVGDWDRCENCLGSGKVPALGRGKRSDVWPQQARRAPVSGPRA